MIKHLDHRNEQTADDIIAVQMPAYRVEAALIGFDGIPALQDTAESIKASNEEFVGYSEAGRLVGVIAYEAGDGEIDICRLVVHPDHFRKGVATKLLEHVLEHAAAGKRAVVSTGRNNAPAIALYTRYGFIESGAIEVAPGFFIANLVRRA
ncbi:MAG: family N-acetyltransferase [Paenibacillus sp.]|jgi:ribosomal protein S18 acetylase RimI-like enzyme|nr:family N-acetyltransferase [Paenibacillus sp.]